MSLDGATSVIRFTPTANFNGTASFYYTVTDSATRQSTYGKVDVDVAAANDTPTATYSVTSVSTLSDNVSSSLGVINGLPWGPMRAGDLITSTAPPVQAIGSMLLGNTTVLLGILNDQACIGTGQNVTNQNWLVTGTSSVTWRRLENVTVYRINITPSDVETNVANLSLNVVDAPRFGTLVAGSQPGEWFYTRKSLHSAADAFFVEVADPNGAKSEIKVLIGNQNGAASVMQGTANNDTYIVDNEADQILESKYDYNIRGYIDQGGIDTVVQTIELSNYQYSWWYHQLSNFVENLTLAGDAVTGEGNSLDNYILGNAKNNRLLGDA